MTDRRITHRTISLGGGVQSSVILLMANAGDLEPAPDMAIFADTDWEPSSVYEHLEWLESVSEIPIVRVSNGRSLREDSANWVQQQGRPNLALPVFITNPDGSKGMVQHRQCTDRYKIVPIHQYLRRELLNLEPGKRVPKDVMIEQWLGISYDEPMRMRDSRQAWISLRYPLIDLKMTRRDCHEWFQERYPDRSLPRSACSGCPFRSDREWLHLKSDNPDDFKEAIRVDTNLRTMAAVKAFKGTPYLHGRRKPVEEAVEDYERELAMNPMLPGLESGAGNECAGVCFV